MTDRQHDSEAEIVEKVDALRQSLEQDDSVQRWSRQISLLGFLAALVGVVFWAATLSERNQETLLVHPPIDVSALDARWHWIGAAIEQGVVAHLMATPNVRLLDTSTATIVGASVIPPHMVHDDFSGWVVDSEIVPSLDRSGGLTLKVSLSNAEVGGHDIVLSGDIAALSDLTSRYLTQLSLALELPTLSPERQEVATAQLPEDASARRHLAAATASLRHHAGREALEHLRRIDEASADHPLVQLAYADAWAMLGYQAESDRFAESAYGLREPLNRELQLRIEGRYHANRSEWGQAEGAYRALWAFYPTELSYGLALVNAQLSASHGADALATVNELRSLPSPFGDDPRIDLAEAILHWRLGDWQSGIGPIDRAIATARMQGATDLEATALQRKFELTDEQPDVGLLEQAEQLFRASGNARGLTQTLISRGLAHRRDGELDRAEPILEEALRLARTRGDEADAARAMSELAIAKDLQADPESGLRWKRQVHANLVRRGMATEAAIARENLGHSLLKLGRLDEALTEFTQAGEEFVEVGDRIGIAWRPYHRARILAAHGNLEDAMSAARRAVENAQERPEGALELHARFEIGSIHFHAGELDSSADVFAALVHQYQDAGLTVNAAEAQTMLAKVRRVADLETDSAPLLASATATLEPGGNVYTLLPTMVERVDSILNWRVSEASRHQELARACDWLRAHSRTPGLHQFRGRVRVVLCDETPSEIDTRLAALDAIAEETEPLGLFQVRMDVHAARVHLLRQAGRREQARTVEREMREAAALRNWSLLEYALDRGAA